MKEGPTINTDVYAFFHSYVAQVEEDEKEGEEGMLAEGESIGSTVVTEKVMDGSMSMEVDGEAGQGPQGVVGVVRQGPVDGDESTSTDIVTVSPPLSSAPSDAATVATATGPTASTAVARDGAANDVDGNDTTASTVGSEGEMLSVKMEGEGQGQVTGHGGEATAGSEATNGNLIHSDADPAIATIATTSITPSPLPVTVRNLSLEHGRR